MIPGKLYQHTHSMRIVIYDNDPRRTKKSNIIGMISDSIVICIVHDGTIRKILTNDGIIGWIYYCEDRWKEL
jgi:hypothetical protein